MTKVTHLTLDEGGGLNRRRIHLREISGEADTPLETIGQDLRAARLRRGDDLATASKALKIRKDHLEALEEDRLESLPGRTYAIGFVRSYAEYLGLDSVESVERFKSEIAGRDETPKTPVFHDNADERRLPHGWAVIALVIVGLVIYGAYRLARSADSLLTEPVAPVPARMAPAAQEQETPPAPQPAATPVATPPAAAPSGDSADNSAPATGSGAAVLAKPTITSGGLLPPLENSTPNQTTASIAPPSMPEAAPPPSGQVYGLHNTDARVILRAETPARVLVEGADGVVYINRTLRAGDSYRVPDRVGLTLTTPDAGALQIELDGQMMGLAGRPKQMAEALSLDPQAVVDRYYGRQLH